MKNAIAILFAVSILLLGCARNGWYKPGVSENDTRTRLAQCKYEVGMKKDSQMEKEDLISSCMEGQGFRIDE